MHVPAASPTSSLATEPSLQGRTNYSQESLEEAPLVPRRVGSASLLDQPKTQRQADREMLVTRGAKAVTNLLVSLSIEHLQ